MNSVSHQSPGLWTHPRDRSHRYTDPDHWVELARLLERGRFDGMFIADILGMSHRTVNKHLEHVFEKLGVETRSAAAAIAGKLLPQS
eukprot:gene23308-43790_t